MVIDPHATLPTVYWAATEEDGILWEIDVTMPPGMHCKPPFRSLLEYKEQKEREWADGEAARTEPDDA